VAVPVHREFTALTAKTGSLMDSDLDQRGLGLTIENWHVREFENNLNTS
jgi:hypothetical protein